MILKYKEGREPLTVGAQERGLWNQSLALWLFPNYLSYLRLSFSICKMGKNNSTYILGYMRMKWVIFCKGFRKTSGM